MVLDAGKLVEFDSPSNLLKTPNSIFASLAEEAGAAEMEKKRRVSQTKTPPNSLAEPPLLLRPLEELRQKKEEMKASEVLEEEENEDLIDLEGAETAEVQEDVDQTEPPTALGDDEDDAEI